MQVTGNVQAGAWRGTPAGRQRLLEPEHPRRPALTRRIVPSRPRPAEWPPISSCAAGASNQTAQALFVNDLNTELFCFIEFGSGFFSGQQKVSLLTDRAGHLATSCFDLCLCF